MPCVHVIRSSFMCCMCCVVYVCSVIDYVLWFPFMVVFLLFFDMSLLRGVPACIWTLDVLNHVLSC